MEIAGIVADDIHNKKQNSQGVLHSLAWSVGMPRTIWSHAILRSYELMINCHAFFVTSQKDIRMNLSFFQ